MELPEGWDWVYENWDEDVFYAGSKPPPLKSVVELAALGYMWIESEPCGGSTFAFKGKSPDHGDIPISDYIAKRRSENGTA